MQHLSRIVSYSANRTLARQHPSWRFFLSSSFFSFSNNSLKKLQFGVTSNLSGLGSGHFLKWSAVGFSRGSKFATGFTPLQRKALDSIIDIERSKSLSAEDLISVWEDYHLGRGHIGTAIKAQLYYALDQRSLSCRHFVIPLRRGSGYTSMFIQGSSNCYLESFLKFRCPICSSLGLRITKPEELKQALILPSPITQNLQKARVWSLFVGTLSFRASLMIPRQDGFLKLLKLSTSMIPDTDLSRGSTKLPMSSSSVMF